MIGDLPVISVGVEFLRKWIPLQFNAWQRAQAVLNRAHSDKGISWESLPDNVKQMILGFIPLQMALLAKAGSARLRRMREAGRSGNRAAVADILMSLAQCYHDAWHVVRELWMSSLQQAPKRRPDDKPWAEITDSERQVVLEIIWQWCILFAEMEDQDFEVLITSSD